MTRLLLKFSIALSLLLTLNSCTNKDKLIGCWDAGSVVISLKKDGTLITNSKHGNGVWKLIDNDRLNFIYADGSNDTHTIVKLNNDFLIIKYNGLLEYTWPKTKCDDLENNSEDIIKTNKKQHNETKDNISPEKLIEILNSSQDLILPLPTNMQTLKSSIGDYSLFSPVDPDDPSPWGGEYIWNFTNGFILSALTPNMEQAPKENDEITMFSLKSKDKREISVPSYRLILNKSSINDCKKLYGNSLKTLSPTYLKINENGIRSYFSFTDTGILEQITQATGDIENYD